MMAANMYYFSWTVPYLMLCYGWYGVASIPLHEPGIVFLWLSLPPAAVSAGRARPYNLNSSSSGRRTVAGTRRRSGSSTRAFTELGENHARACLSDRRRVGRVRTRPGGRATPRPAGRTPDGLPRVPAAAGA